MQRLTAFRKALTTVAHPPGSTVVHAPQELPVQSDAVYRLLCHETLSSSVLVKDMIHMCKAGSKPASGPILPGICFSKGKLKETAEMERNLSCRRDAWSWNARLT